MDFRILPIPTGLAEAARRTGRAPGYGHAVQASVAGESGYGPCRHCLRRTRAGERRLLLTYNPYAEAVEVPVAGPIFIHEEACGAFGGLGFPEELRGLPLLLWGHLRDGDIRQRRPGEDPEAAIQALLADTDVAFVSIRNAEAGCFVARAERTGSVDGLCPAAGRGRHEQAASPSPERS